MDYQLTAQEILLHVGGKENVKSLAHCATRLRFNLIDESQFNQDGLKAIPGVMGTIISGGQQQVIIGTDVSHVYSSLAEVFGDSIAAGAVDEREIGRKRFAFSDVLDTISGIFTPILPAITGAAMIKTIIILLEMAGVLTAGTDTYTFLTFVGDTPFYFLPILLSYSAANKFGMNPMMGMVLGLMMIHPTYINLAASAEPARLFGLLPVTFATYTSTVIPIVLVVWAGSYVERWADKISPKAVRFFMKPLVTLLIMVPVAFCLVGPLGTIAGNGLEAVLNVVQTQAPWALPIFFGVAAPIVIMFGMHYVVTIPLVMSAIAVSGFDMIGAGFLVANIAQGGAAFAVAMFAKGDFKAMSASTALTAILGITEPAMYGVNLKLRKPFICALIGGGVGGMICGIAGVKRIVFGPTGLTTIAIFIDPANNLNFIFAMIGIAAAFAVSFGLTYMAVKKDDKIQKEIGV